MSSFLSNKFLQYRLGPAAQPRTIESDLFCTSCGYNLRGLTFGRNCPECGQQIRKTPGLKDSLLQGDWSQRESVKLGLTLTAATLLAVALARLGLFIALVTAMNPKYQDAYLWLGLALSIGWIFGVWLLTPPHLDAHYFKIRWLRRTARWSQLIWIPAYICWILAEMKFPGTPEGDRLYQWSMMLRGLGALGAALFAAWLMRLAVDAELETAARWINLSIWMLPLPTLALISVPSSIPWVAVILVALPLAIWCWYVLLLGRAALIMQRHVSWSMRLAAQDQDRMKRIEQKRAEMDRQVASTIRPLDCDAQEQTIAMNDPDATAQNCRNQGRNG